MSVHDLPMTPNAPPSQPARLIEGTARVAETLVRVERHPGYPLLTATDTVDTTAERCTAARTALASAWLEYMELQAVVDAATSADPAEARRLLTTPSISLEVESTDTFGFVGPTVRRTTPADLLVDLETTLEQVVDLLDECERVQTASFTALLEVRGRVGTVEARYAALVPDADAGSDARRLLDNLQQRVGRDPLGVSGATFDADLEQVRAEIDARAAECTRLEDVRDRWPHLVDECAAAFDGISALARQVESRQHRAGELISGSPQPDAHDRLPDLR